MAFDQTTRNRLQRFVSDARRVLEEEFTRQLQNDYGMDPNAGNVAELVSLRHINDAQRETARILRDTLAHYTASGDMKSGARAGGTPGYMEAQLVGGQLARRYNLPYRTSNTCAANTVDAQAAYESVFSLWGAIQGGGNFMLHGAGWLEGGLRCSYEKTILDVDLLQMVAEFLTPLEVTRDALAVEAILYIVEESFEIELATAGAEGVVGSAS